MFETPLFEWAGRSFGISRSTQLNSDLVARVTTTGFQVEYGNKRLKVSIDPTSDAVCIDNIYMPSGVTARLQWDTTGVLQMVHWDGSRWTLVKDYNAG